LAAVPAELHLRYAPDLLTVEIGANESYSFDRAGCLVRVAWDGHLYRWGFDGSCLQKAFTVRSSEKVRIRHDTAAGLVMAHHAYDRAIRLFSQVQLEQESWRPVLQQITAYGIQLLQNRARRFKELYGDVSILPPDQYGALVLQLTEGCRYNRCSFCTFYKHIPYRVKTLEQFEAHIQGVLDMVGPAIDRRQNLFLGDANALGIPFGQLLAVFELVNRLIPVNPADKTAIQGIYTFLDIFNRRPYTAAQCKVLAQLGLRRVYIGAESGSEQVLQVLRKPNQLHLLHQCVAALKEGGVGVGLIFLLGAGGMRYYHEHAAATTRLLSQLPLDKRDIVYLSELVNDPHSDYALWAEQEDVRPLSPEDARNQEQMIRRALKPVDEDGPRVSRYDVREFIYY
jgi:radical SAM superfamily enzyme YgiQ (UPF0313 family)